MFTLVDTDMTMDREDIPGVILLVMYVASYVGCCYVLWLDSWCWYGCVHMQVWTYSTCSLGYSGTDLLMVLCMVVYWLLPSVCVLQLLAGSLVFFWLLLFCYGSLSFMLSA